MKQVKSKVTGGIGELDFDSKEGVFVVVYYDLYTKVTNKNYYKSLEDLCEEWEDYEEPKQWWYLDVDGEVCETNEEDDMGKDMKSIGNYFETKEEAEKAVEKLKAWKRLRDKGFRFGGWKRDERFYGDYTIEAQDYTTCSDKDLDLLFSETKNER